MVEIGNLFEEETGGEEEDWPILISQKTQKTCLKL
jgi:hypothetical protein